MKTSEFAKGAENIKENRPCKKCNHTPDEHSPLYRLERRKNRADTMTCCHSCTCVKYQ